MVGARGFEPLTSSASRKRSTPELSARGRHRTERRVSGSRRGPELNRCTGFCRPLPNHSATPPACAPGAPGPARQCTRWPRPDRSRRDRALTPSRSSTAWGPSGSSSTGLRAPSTVTLWRPVSDSSRTPTSVPSTSTMSSATPAPPPTAEPAPSARSLLRRSRSERSRAHARRRSIVRRQPRSRVHQSVHTPAGR